MLYSILVCRKNLQKLYTYSHESEISYGQIVTIPIKSKNTFGIVISKIDDCSFNMKIKAIISVHSYILSKSTINLINWSAMYSIAPIGSFAKMFINKDVLLNKTSKIKIDFDNNLNTKCLVKLNTEQGNALKKIKFNDFKVYVLEGVTGSGKTIVYLNAALKIINSGKQALILIPEIALNEQIILEIEKFFGFKPVIYNSSITSQRKREIWKLVYNNELKLIIGTRSALFLPFKDLGLIVVDEEHDSSYKQEQGLIYNAKNTAIMYSKFQNCPIILSSATPSLESIKNCNDGVYEKIILKDRFGGVSMPNISIIKNDSQNIISDKIYLKINEHLNNNKQILLYINRRGYAPIIFCTNCLKKYQCPDCDTNLVLHSKTNIYECHYCGFNIKHSNRCIYCGTERCLKFFGLGVEKIFEEVNNNFSDKNIFIASSDTLNNRKKINNFIKSMQNNEIDIVIGTQIMAKGHNFKNLIFCAILDIDFSINSQDIRSLERTYQMIHQISGRTGRGIDTGEVIIQTNITEEDIHKSLLLHKLDDFAIQELHNRKLYNLPPYSRLVAIIVSGNSETNVKNYITKLCAQKLDKNIRILGPIQAPISKIKGKIRWRILLISNKDYLIQKNISAWINNTKPDKNIEIQIDVDPVSFF